jgi:hypothetical protein
MTRRTTLLVAAASALGFAVPLPVAHAAADHSHEIVAFTYVLGDTLCKGVGPGCGTDAVIAETVAQGDTMTFTNLDPVPHSVISVADGLFDTGTLSTGESATIDTSSLPPGTYSYKCGIHGAALMSGTFIIQ